jgi:hypothetical protein
MGVSPVAVKVWLYAVPAVPFGNDAVVMVGALPVPVLLSVGSGWQAVKAKVIAVTMLKNESVFLRLERRTENGERRTENGERRTENGERRTAFLIVTYFRCLRLLVFSFFARQTHEQERIK